MTDKAILMLEDGRHFIGQALGARAELSNFNFIGQGEVVFNTAMTGYQEVLTDPSYAGQMLCMTYPLQGNYGLRPSDAESERCWVRGFIARWATPQPYHHSANAPLDEYLREQGVPGIAGIDSRALTLHLRSRGALRAVLVHQPNLPDATQLAELQELASQVPPLEAQDLVGEVSCREVSEWLEPLPIELSQGFDPSLGEGIVIGVIDYGVKLSILRSLRARGCRVLRLPSTTTWEDIQRTGVDGLLFSNGPGDPAVLDTPIELCRQALAHKMPLFGICLGHQILARAIGAQTARLPFGHHGVNHPVRDLRSGEVRMTSQNHEFQVIASSIPEDSGFIVSQTNLHDASVEGLTHLHLPIFSVQYHPEGCPGPTDNQHLFDRFLEGVRGNRIISIPPPCGEGPGPGLTQCPEVERPGPWGGGSNQSPNLDPPKRVLILGSGPIIIGQAAEFDYAGTQACRALREEGIETVLVNSNPASIMTDEGVADRVYIEPLTPETIEQIIQREQPDAILPTLGGQTALNLAMELAELGTLQRYGVRFLGADAEVIKKAEDRQAFKQLLLDIGEPVPPSRICGNLQEAREFAQQVGLPLVVRPAYTLGGTGGGFVNTFQEFEKVVNRGLAASPIKQVLIERSLWGWKELEYEVMRDAADTCITICNMENLDPMGVHTGDSMVVAPAQTLTDREHQMLRTAAIRIIRTLGIEGGCNIQFALDPNSSTYQVIEVNPRVSRSSALASKATGYPIARVAAKVAAGKRLDQITNQVTSRTCAAFEPALDYCVVKLPRWPFDKFPEADRELGTQMASTGEVMAIERTFPKALEKALRSLEQRWPKATELANPALIDRPNDLRLFALLHALKVGADPAELAQRSGIDRWFIDRFQELVEQQNESFTPSPTPPRKGEGKTKTVYKLVDTCAGEFEAATPYFYSSSGEEPEVLPDPNPAGLIVGSGPIRIGQGIEFDYCSVHAAATLRSIGKRAIMINSNPETVSTDFDISDRLYFEPLDLESVENVARSEQVEGALVQFGGQTAINLAEPLQKKNISPLGSSVEAIDLAEDRRLFAAALTALNIAQPLGQTTTSIKAAQRIAEEVGYPVLLRPSYVLGGRGMEIVHDRAELERYMHWAAAALPRGEVLIDKYLTGTEVEVEAVSDGECVMIPGIMQHIERAGVHSGDSYAVYPGVLSAKEETTVVEHTIRIARHLKLRGLVNVQYVIHQGEIYVLEVNPRASRTVPILSKVTGVPMVELATRIMFGERLTDLGYQSGLLPPRPLVAVKAPVFSMNKLPSVDSHLGPEMKSTGEVLGLGRTLPEALGKAFLAAGMTVKAGSTVVLTIADVDKPELLPIAAMLDQLNCQLLATPGTASLLRKAGYSVREVAKIGEPSPNVVDVIADGTADLVINTMSPNLNGTRSKEGTLTPSPTPPRPTPSEQARRGPRAGAGEGERSFKDGFEIRQAAVLRPIPCLTSLDTAIALLNSTCSSRSELEVQTVPEWRSGKVGIEAGKR